MRITAISLVALVATAGGVAALGAQRPSGFSYDPVPRWTEEAETTAVCEIMRKECAGQFKDDTIEADWGFAELYNADGYLVGLRSTKSTGCKPLDEHMLVGQRHFVTVFSKNGEPDLDKFTVELAPGTNPDSVQVVKRGETSVSIGCDPR